MRKYSAALSAIAWIPSLFAREILKDQAAFEAADACVWEEQFFDACTNDWREQWFLDGEVAAVRCSPAGMQLTAGPQFGNDAHHMVLWTEASFQGDVRIEYDFTRRDFETRCVNILYIQATGSGEGPYAEDIRQWSELRRLPAMKLYFNHMNVFHISYAAFPMDNDDPENVYLRGRRYMPESEAGLSGTDLKPDYYPYELFKPGVLHHITVIKTGCDILMRVENLEQTCFFKMSNPDTLPVTAGRIGLRLMYTRSSLFKNFRISTVE